MKKLNRIWMNPICCGIMLVPMIFSVSLLAVEYRGGNDSTWISEKIHDSVIFYRTAAIALGSDNVPRIAGVFESRQYDENSIEYIWLNGNVWNRELVDLGDDVGGFDLMQAPVIGLSKTNVPRIAYAKEDTGLFFAWKSGLDWNKKNVDPLGRLYFSMKVGSDEKVHISYFASNELKYALWDGVVWSTKTIDTGGVGHWNSLALDRNGKPYISYYDYTNSDLKVARWTGIKWSTETVMANGTVGKYSSIAMNSSDLPCVAYTKEDSGGGTGYSCWNGSSWEHQEIIAFGTELSLAFDSFGKPFIAYQMSRSLRYLTFVESDWREWRIGASQGVSPSLVFGSDGSRHIVSGWTGLFYLKSHYFEYPTELDVSTRTANSITWKWKDNSSKENGFLILDSENLNPLSDTLPANTTEWTQPGLSPNTKASVIVRAFNSATVVDSEKSPIRYSLAAIPTITGAKITEDDILTVNFSTNGNPRYTYYYVDYSTDSKSYVISNNPTAYPEYGYRFSGLPDGNEYHFRIRASNVEEIFSSYSYFGESFILPNVSPPLAPTNLLVLERKSKSLTWGWADTARFEKGFKVLRNSDSEVLADLPPNTTYWTHSGISPNSLDRIQVMAYNDFGTKKTERLYYPTEEYSLANTPKDFIATRVNDSNIFLSWSSNENPEGTTYIIEKGKKGEAFTSTITTTSLSCLVPDMAPETHFRFQIHARNHGGVPTETIETESLPVVSTGAPKSPTFGSILVVSSTSIESSWESPNGAEYFNLGASLINEVPPLSQKAFDHPRGMVDGLIPNALYHLFVQACNSDGCSPFGRIGSTMTFAGKPGLTLETVGHTTVGLTIDRKGNPYGTEYVVEYWKKGGSFRTSFSTTSLTSQVEGLDRGTAYEFSVKAKNHIGTLTDMSDPVGAVTVPNVPMADGLITVTESSVSAGWKATAGATGYTLAVSLKNENPPDVLKFQDTVDLKSEITELLFNTTYYLFVKASNAAGSSEFLSLGKVVTYATKPRLSGGAVGVTTVELRIDPKGNPAGTVYVVEQSKAGGLFKTLFSTTSLTSQVEGLDRGTAYEFRAKAKNHFGTLTEATELVGAVTVPNVPMADGLITATESSVSAGWKAMAGATGYTLAVSLKNENPPDVLKFQDTVDLKSEITGLLFNTTYYLFVKASNAAGSSEFLSMGDVVTYATKPGLSVGAKGETSVELTIDPKGNPAGTVYSIEFKLDEGDYSHKLTTTSLSLAVDGLSHGSNFSSRVRAVNRNNETTDYTYSKPFRLAPAKPVRGELESVGVDGSKVSWDSSSGAKSYTVLASMFEEDPRKEATPFLTENTSIALTGLTPNTTYYLSVQAVNEGVVSKLLSIGRMVTLAAVPGLSLDPSGTNSIRIIIEPNGNPPGTVYEVEARRRNDGDVKKISTTSLFLTMEGLESEAVYQFQVRAVNHQGITTAYSPVLNGETVKPAITTVAEARAYPVPFRPGSNQSSMTFDQIPIGSTIRVYTMSGTLVKELQAEAESVQWNVKNDDGEDVSSGVYLIRVSGSGGDKTFKILVQR